MKNICSRKNNLNKKIDKKILALKKNFRQFCQIFILYVRELFEEFHSQKRFFSNLFSIFSQNVSNFGKTFQQNRQHVFYLSSGTLLQKHYVDFVK